ncbi:outer membrane beta-barrel family protein [Phaeocystidibacter marisrubri]|nr:outer membrane beta-barrel family protein [Phaeocystidibacter marisrubri]GGH77231.1 TonB-dependent receptor [Phaeocystidibacter marisrubri]
MSKHYKCVVKRTQSVVWRLNLNDTQLLYTFVLDKMFFMQRISKFVILTVLLAVSSLGMAQQKGITFTGTVVDASNSEPLPYTVVAIRNSETDELTTSVTTDIEGAFTVSSPISKVYVEIVLMGYEDVQILPSVQSGTQNLGTIQMTASSQNLNEVEIVAERSSVEFQMDKRVFNVGSDLSTSGMGAMDVLNNVPSVNVDIEGQVSLRGNSGVQIMINGKPSVLSDDPSNALGTITADMIERIEVITNPSAKYQAEGTSGILNIVLKKEEKKGMNGSVSLNTGYPNNHSVGASLNYRTENFNFFTQLGAGYRTRPNYNESISQNSSDSLTIQSSGEDYRNEEFYNITLGTDYYINDLNVITLSGNFAYEIESQPSETNFEIYDPKGNLNSAYSRIEETSALNPKYRYDLQYSKQFEDHEDHQLIFSTLGHFFGKDQSSEFFNSYEVGTANFSDQRTATNFYQTDYTFKLDYTDPLSELFTLETGAMYEINDVGNDYSVRNLKGSVWEIDSSLTNDFTYIQKVLAGYVTGAYETESWGVKVGVRVENTELTTVLENTGDNNYQNYSNLFPSLHTHYKWGNGFSLQAGYSKRIYRPRLWNLNPFFNIRNNYNVRTGNPELQPEFADSYELTGILVRNDYSINASLYYLYTTDVVEYVTRYENGVNLTMPINIGTRQKVGVEVNGKWTVTDWFDLTGDFNYGYFTRDADYQSQNFDYSSDQWDGKLTTKFALPAEFDLEITTRYNSSYETIQGRVSGFAFFNAGVRKKLWNGKLVMNLGVQDIFATRVRETTINQPNYYMYNFSQRGTFLTFGISYGFGKGEAMSYSGGGRH